MGSTGSLGNVSLSNVSLGKPPEEKHDQAAALHVEKKYMDACAVGGMVSGVVSGVVDGAVDGAGGVMEGRKEDHSAEGGPCADGASGADARAADDKKKQNKKKKEEKEKEKEKEKDPSVKLQSDAHKGSGTPKQVAANSWASPRPGQSIQDGTSLLYYMSRSNMGVGMPPGGFPSGGFPANGFPPNGLALNGFPPNSFAPNGFPPNSFAPNGGTPGDWNEPERQPPKGEPLEVGQFQMGKGDGQEKHSAEVLPNDEKDADQDKKRKKEKKNKKKKGEASSGGNENGVVGAGALAGEDKGAPQAVGTAATAAASAATTQAVVPPHETAKSDAAKGEAPSANTFTSFLSKIMQHKADAPPSERYPNGGYPNGCYQSGSHPNGRTDSAPHAEPVANKNGPALNSNGHPVVGHNKEGSNTHPQRSSDALHGDLYGLPKSGANKNSATSSPPYQPHFNPLANGALLPMQSGNSPLLNHLSGVKHRLQGSSHHPQGTDGPSPNENVPNGGMYLSAFQHQSYGDVSKGGANQSSHLYMSNQQGKAFYASAFVERGSNEGPINDSSSNEAHPSNGSNELSRGGSTPRAPPGSMKSNEDLLSLFKRVLPHATVNIVPKNQHLSSSSGGSDSMLNAPGGHPLIGSVHHVESAQTNPRRNLMEAMRNDYEQQMGFKREHQEVGAMAPSNEHLGKDEGGKPTHGGGGGVGGGIGGGIGGGNNSGGSGSGSAYAQRGKEIHNKDLATAMIMRMKLKEEQPSEGGNPPSSNRMMVVPTSREHSIPASIKSHLCSLDLCELLKCYHSLNVQIIQLKLYWIYHKIQAYDSGGNGGGNNATELMSKEKKIVAKVKEMKTLLDYANDLVKSTFQKNKKKYEILIHQFTVILKQHDHLYQQKKEKIMRDHSDKEPIVHFICNIDRIVHRCVAANGEEPLSSSPSFRGTHQPLASVDARGEVIPLGGMQSGNISGNQSGYAGGYAGGYSNSVRKTPPPMDLQHKLLMQKLSEQGRHPEGLYDERNLNQNKITLADYQRNYLLNAIGGGKDEQAMNFLKRSGGNGEQGAAASLEIAYADEQEDKKNSPLGRAGGYEAASRGSMYLRDAQSMEAFPLDGHSGSGNHSGGGNISSACASPLLNRINKALLNKPGKEDGAQDREGAKDLPDNYGLLELLRKKKLMELQGGLQSGVHSRMERGLNSGMQSGMQSGLQNGLQSALHGGLLGSLRAASQGRDDHMDAGPMLRKAHQGALGGKSVLHAASKEEHQQHPQHGRHQQHQQQQQMGPPPADHLNYYFQNAQADQTAFTSQAKHESNSQSHSDRVKTQVDMMIPPMGETMKQDAHGNKQQQQYAPPKDYIHFSDYNSFVKSASMNPSGVLVNSQEEISAQKEGEQSNGGGAPGAVGGSVGGAVNDQRTSGSGEVHPNYMPSEANQSEDHHPMPHPNASHPPHALPPAQPAQMVCKIPSIYKTSSTNKSMNSSGEKKNATYSLFEMEEAKRPDALRDKCWQYVDPKGVVQGPFFLDEMRIWSEMGYFEPMLPVRCCDSDRFVALNKLFPPPHKPFTIIPKPQPILQWDEEL
ncbi:hypothetical protein PVBG_03839 [Plasmodium vivax Brazil I]|uniref:GYF domain-containing protein n=1 Tax=Plasmodium vivax (strain Brazil I) TaxID=1033975 RepID=A0A0J9VLA7_PLAV1|nr:hypothetical protein PVBG_03839 [Plasmodium vivax Brazil I]